MIEQRKNESIFPDLPRQIPVIDKSGDFNSLWSLSFSSLFQALQNNWKSEGIIFPPLSSMQMNSIQSLYIPYIGGTYNSLTMNLPDISGQTVYDSTTQITNQFIISQDNSGNVNLAKWVPFSVLLTNAGNPNGSPPSTPAVSGVINWLCFDTLGVQLYICTTAGSTGSIPVISPLSPAVWTAI